MGCQYGLPLNDVKSDPSMLYAGAVDRLSWANDKVVASVIVLPTGPQRSDAAKVWSAM